MKHIKQLLVFLLIISVFNSCEKEEVVSYALDDISAPTNIDALFDISAEEVGLVTITPSADGATMFEIYFGDEENETPMEVAPGETVTHVYGEGEFNLRIVAIGLTGLTSELVRVVTISLEAPEDLEVDIKISGTNPYEIEVSASATNATVFDIYFGDTEDEDRAEDEEPVTIMAGDTATYEYSETGDYTVRVVARGAGAATLEYTEEISITGAVNAVTLPITFEDATVNYAVSGFGAADFGPIPAEVIENPDPSGINTSANVLSVNKTADAQVWAGASIPLAAPIDFTNGSTISLKVWSPRAGTPILLKIEDSSSEKDENGNPTIFVEIQVSSTLVNTWEELTFDLSSNENFSTSNSYDTVIVFPDFGTVGKGELFYFDDIKLAAEGTENGVKLPITFDDAAVSYTVNGFGAADFGPIPAEVIENPDASGINTTAKVLSVNKLQDAQVWAGASIPLEGPIDFTNGTTVSLKVWSPRAGTPILLKIEDSNSPANNDGNPTVFVEIQTSSTLVNTWEEITFDLSSIESFSTSIPYDTVIVFPDFGTAGKGEFYYFDDIKLVADGDGGDGGTEAEVATSLPMNFEDNKTFSGVFEAGQGVTGELVENPDKSGENTSETVFQFTKANGAAWYSGIFQIFPSNIDLSTDKSFTFKIWSPKAGINVRMNLEKEGEGGGPALSIDQTLTEANKWVTLTYNFSDLINEGDAYDKLVIFPDFNDVAQAPSDGSVYYIDDLEQTSGGDSDGGNGDGGSSACVPETSESLNAADFNLTFLTNDVNVVQDNANYARTANPKEDAVNSSCFVGEVKNLNQNPWDNIQIDLNAKLDFDANAGFKIKVFSPKAGTKVTVKLEEIGNAGNSTEVGVARTKTGEWEELTIPFSSSASGKFDKIVLFFDLESTNGDTYYFDDLKLYPRTDGGTDGGTDSGASGDVASNGDFETGNLDGWAVYKNGGIIEADNTQSNGGDWSAKIVASSPNGLNPTLKQERKGAGTVAVGDIVQIKFDYMGSAAGGGIYSIQSFVEAENGVNQTEVFSVTPTATWQTFTATYTVNAGDVSGGITMEFTAICGGDPGCSSTLILDNVSVILNP